MFSAVGFLDTLTWDRPSTFAYLRHTPLLSHFLGQTGPHLVQKSSAAFLSRSYPSLNANSQDFRHYCDEDRFV